jgi:phosphoribosylformylglycinamidine synthase
MLAALRELIPGAAAWPDFVDNCSEQFEARLSLVEVEDTPSVFFQGMAGSRIPVATAHGEGRADFHGAETPAQLITLRYVDNTGDATEHIRKIRMVLPVGLPVFVMLMGGLPS